MRIPEIADQPVGFDQGVKQERVSPWPESTRCGRSCIRLGARNRSFSGPTREG